MNYIFIDSKEETNKVGYSHERYKINDVIKAGEEVIVQVIKEPLGNKGPKVSTHISIPGRYIVITPYSNRVHISKKITDYHNLKILKSLGKDIIQDEIGVIFRTVSQGIDESLIRAEYNSLIEIYNKIEMERSFLPSPKLIYRDLDLIYQIVRDTFND